MKITKYEAARIIGARALQIAMGAPILANVGEKTMGKIRFNPIEVAKIEFEKELLPITIKRPLPSN